LFFFLFFTQPPTIDISPLSLHDALPIYQLPAARDGARRLPGQRRLRLPRRARAPVRRARQLLLGRHPLRTGAPPQPAGTRGAPGDRKSTRLNSSHVSISYAVFCLKKKKK